MIPVKEFGESLEKNAGAAGTVLKYMAKHPWQFIIPALAVGGTLSIGKTVHPLHQIIREETKSRGMKQQRDILSEILNEQKKSNAPAPAAQALKTEPLT